MVDFRTPRGYGRRHPAYQELMEGQRPTVKGLKAASFLPIKEVESKHDDAIVIPAGTWVGIVAQTGQSSSGNLLWATGDANQYRIDAPTGAFVGPYAMVPAASRAYSITYTALDADTTFSLNGLVVDIDTRSAVANAKVSTSKVGDQMVVTGGGVKPIGITYQDIYAGGYGVQFNNYERQPNIGFLTSNMLIQVPCMSTGETAIQPGDKVVIDGWDQPSLTWDPTLPNYGGNNVGRLRRYQDIHTQEGNQAAYPQGGGGFIDQWAATAANIGSTVTGMMGWIRTTAAMQEHVVGRCLRKIKIGSGGTANQVLSTAISAGTIRTTSSVNYEFRHAGRVQTVPGLGLQGSGTLGLPGWLLSSRADRNGNWWALEILVGTY